MTEKTKRSEPKIRRAKSGDAADLAALSGELGYPATAAEIKSRLSRLKSAANDALFVAECDGEVIGWLHISVNHLIEVPTRAEINAFIVSEKQRSNGLELDCSTPGRNGRAVKIVCICLCAATWFASARTFFTNGTASSTTRRRRRSANRFDTLIQGRFDVTR